MALKEVKSYKTRDNAIFESKIEAEKHEAALTLRALVQQTIRTDSLSPLQFGKFAVDNLDSVIDTLINLRRKVNAAGRTRKPPENLG